MEIVKEYVKKLSQTVYLASKSFLPKFYQSHRIVGASQKRKHESWSNTTFRDRRNMQIAMDTDKVRIQIPNSCLWVATNKGCV